MNTYYESSFALATQQTGLVWTAFNTCPLLSALCALLLLLLLQRAGLTLTQEVVLFPQESPALSGRHPAAVGT